MNTQQLRLASADVTGGRPRPPQRNPTSRRRSTEATQHCPHRSGDRRVGLDLLLTTTPALASPASRPGATQTTSGPDVELRTLLNDVAAAGVPGIVARVQDGREIRLATAGVADVATGAALHPQARFRVGSTRRHRTQPSLGPKRTRGHR
jgi:hypothetical protein